MDGSLIEPIRTFVERVVPDPIGLTESGVSGSEVGIHLQGVIEVGDGTIDVLWFLVLQQVSSSAKVGLVARRLGGCTGYPGFTNAVLTRKNPENLPDDLVFEREQFTGIAGDRTRSDLAVGSR